MLVGIGGVGALGVEDGHRRRQHLVGHVMVADDEVDALFLSIGNLLDRLDAAVEHDNQSYACRLGEIHTFSADAVALLIAVGDVEIDVGCELLQESVDERHGRTTVDVVVAVHQYAFLASERPVQAVHGHPHVAKQEGVEQLAQLWAEETPSLGRRGDTTVQ